MSSTKNAHSDFSSLGSIEEVLGDLGIQNIKPCGDDEVQFSCPYPGHKNNDSNPSAFYSLSKNVFHCFGCGTKGTIETLYKFLTGEEINAFSIAQLKFNQVKNSAHKVIDILEAKDNEIRTYPEEILDIYKDIPKTIYDYLIKRVKRPEIIKWFDLGYDKDSQKVTIPIRNGDKKIVGIIGHTPYAKKFKYVPLVPEIGYQKRLFLYGMDKIDRKNDTAILVEGLFDVIAGYSLGYQNVIATQGVILFEDQENFLRMNFNNVFLGLDGDKIGIDAIRQLKKHLKYKFTQVERFYYPEGIKDFGDMINN